MMLRVAFFVLSAAVLVSSSVIRPNSGSIELQPKPKSVHTYTPVGECHGHEEGTPTYLPDSDDCQVYYECNNGIAVPNVCAGKLQWNSILHVCDFPENVKCDKSKKIKPFSAVGECRGHEDGSPTYLPDSDNCQIYYECNNGHAVSNVCPGELQWNSILNVCDFPGNVKCDKPQKGKPYSAVGECPSKPGSYPVYLPDDEDCSAFYECSNGVPLELRCAPGDLFDSVSNICVLASNARCYNNADNKASKITKKSQPKTIQPFSPIGECHGHEDGTPTYLADSDDCQIYYECNNGIAVPNACAGKLQWNSVLHVCDFPENVKCDKSKKSKPFSAVGECHGHEDGTPTYLPDSDNCQIYYECNNGSPVSNVCPGKLQWNSILNVCDFPENVKCDKSIKAKSYL